MNSLLIFVRLLHKTWNWKYKEIGYYNLFYWLAHVTPWNKQNWIFLFHRLVLEIKEISRNKRKSKIFIYFFWIFLLPVPIYSISLYLQNFGLCETNAMCQLWTKLPVWPSFIVRVPFIITLPCKQFRRLLLCFLKESINYELIMNEFDKVIMDSCIKNIDKNKYHNKIHIKHFTMK